jgi:hypothetical protein
VGDAWRQIFSAGGKQDHAERGAHESLENLAKMGTGCSIEAGKGFVQEQQAGRPAKRTRQLEALGFAVGQGKNSATEERPESEVFDKSVLEAIKMPSSLNFGAGRAGDFKGIPVEDAFIREEAANGAAGGFFEAVPPGLDNGLMELGTPVFECNVGNGFFRAQAGRRAEMVGQVSTHQGQMTSDGIREKGFARTVGTENGPVFAGIELPGSVFENQTVAETKGGVLKREEGFRPHPVYSGWSRDWRRRRAAKD